MAPQLTAQQRIGLQRALDDYLAGAGKMDGCARRHGVSPTTLWRVLRGHRDFGLRIPPDLPDRVEAVRSRWRSLGQSNGWDKRGRVPLERCETCGREYKPTNEGQRACRRRCVVKVAPETRATIVDLAREGVPDAIVARRLGSTRPTVKKFRQLAGVAAPRPYTKLADVREKLLELHAQGLTDDEMRAHGIRSALYFRRRLGLPANDQWERPGRREKAADVIRSALGKRWKKAQRAPTVVNPDAAALFEKHQHLAKFFLHKFFPSDSCGATYDDRLSMALAGIWRAAQTYDPSVAAFSTWAEMQVRGAISTGMRSYGYHYEPAKRGRWNHLRFTDIKVPDGDESDFVATLAVDNRQPEDALLEREPREAVVSGVRSALDRLPLRERTVLALRMAGRTLDAIGQLYGVTRERIRQVELRAQAALRADARLVQLAEAG